MDGVTYVILMKKVVDEIVEKWPRGDWKTPEYTVYVQDDCAPGHRKKSVEKELQEYLASLVRRNLMLASKIVFIQTSQHSRLISSSTTWDCMLLGKQFTERKLPGMLERSFSL